MVENVLQKLIDLFTAGGANFHVLEHEASGKSSQSVAQIRGTELGQGAKALVCHVKGNGLKLYVLAVLPADKQADLTKLAQALGARLTDGKAYRTRAAKIVRAATSLRG